MHKNSHWNSFFLVPVFTLSLTASVGQAATINVTSNADNDIGCTLRNAVFSANSDISVGGCAAGSGEDVIDLSAISGSTIILAEGLGFGEIEIAESSLLSTTIEGAGVTIEGGGASRIFHIYTPMMLNDVTLTGGATANGGGAIMVRSGTTLVIQNSTLSSNISTSASPGQGGGAIAVAGHLIVKNSALVNNSAIMVGGAINGYGGSDIQLLNTTLSNNFAVEGAGVYVGGANLAIVQSTLAANQATTGGALRSLNSAVQLTNSILADTVGGQDCEASISTFTPTGVNLVENKGSCTLTASPDLLEADPLLGPYAANGGPTGTHLPQDGSPVIDAGSDAAVPVGLLFDQRGPGFLRLAGLRVDLGSVEVQDPEQTGPDFVVTVADDVDDGLCRQAPGQCSLREALIAANANADASTISFDNSLLVPAATITLAGTALPTVSTEVTIDAAGITVDGNQTSRLFEVAAGGQLTLRQMTLANGFDAVSGGAVSVEGQLLLKDSTLTGNASGFGGAIYVAGGAALINSTVSGNSAVTSGGGMFASGATVELIQTTFSGNSSGAGAGFYNSGGDFTLTNSVIANSSGGGPDCERTGGTFTLLGVNLIEDQGACGIPGGADLIEGSDPMLGALGDNGGPTPTLLPAVDSPVRNSGDDGLVTEAYDQRGPGFDRIVGATVDLGAIELQVNPQIGPDFVVNNLGDSSDGYCDIAPLDCSLREALIAANANADASTISFDNSLLVPAATITLAGTALPTVSTEVAIDAAGITVDGDQTSRLFEVAAGGQLTLRQMTLANGFDAVSGGAINVAGQLLLKDSTLTGNDAAFGGAIYVDDGGDFTLTNSTVSGNSAATSGGGIFAYFATVALIQSTISGNSGDAGAGIENVDSDFTLTNSVIANSFGDGLDCDSSGGTFTLSGVNLIEDQGACGIPGGADLIEGSDPMLGALGDNGGPTPTLLPASGSPVIDSGDNLAVPAGLDFDQRGPGFPRLQGATVDLGSIEVSDLSFQDGFEAMQELGSE